MASSGPGEGADISVSVVSHSHDAWLPGLLAGLARTGPPVVRQVLLTHNLPAAAQPAEGWPFELVQIHNPRPQGFGANHNQAFRRAVGEGFCVLNPDIELKDPRLWPALAARLREPGVGALAPRLLNADGSAQDHRRALVTPWALFKRRVLRRPDSRVDWFSASFLLMPAAAYREVGGFDEGFHMYCEDVDLCLRLRLAGHRLECVEASATHHAQRASLRSWRPLAWHLASLVRLWTRRSYWDYLLRCRPGSH